MKNNKIKIVLLSLIVLSGVAFVGTVEAANASLSVSPATLTENVGSQFSISVVANTSGAKICAVEGTLALKNLSCNAITVSDGVMPQSSPTCANPYFLVGIPGCATANKTLLTVAVKGSAAGIASANLTAVDIIDNNGKSISSDSTGGVYTINAPVTVPTAPAPVTKPVVNKKPVNTLPEQPTVQPNTQPTAQPNENQNQVKVTSKPSLLSSALAGILPAIENILAGNGWFSILLIIIILLVIIYLIYLFIKKKKETNKENKESDKNDKIEK